VRELKTKEDLDFFIKADLYRYFGDCSEAAFKKAYKNIPGFKFTYWLRRCDYLSRRPVYTRPLFYRALRKYKKLKFKYGFDIEYSTKIGAGFYLGHWGGVVINGDAVIGENCNISHQVTIGTDAKHGQDAIPVIGDKVYIAPGCRVFGKITLGDGCAVGANSVVFSDVPPGTTAAGIPAKIVSQNGSERYVNNIYMEN
jgi:serine O-acetyltransferase